MKKWLQQLFNTFGRFVRANLKTLHGRFVLAGLTIGLCYLPIWLRALTVAASQGSAGLPLIVSVVFLAVQELRKHRKSLSETSVSEEDQLLGHLLITCGILIFPFCQFALWPRAILWALILLGIAISSWGLGFFARYPLPTLLIALSVYPHPGVMARTMWQSLTPYKFLEQVMAQYGVWGLRAIGFSAEAKDSVVAMSNGAVDVGWSCNGFNTAFSFAAAGLIMGLFLKQSWQKTMIFMVIGIVLALVFNGPRIMLLAIAAVYWGSESFNFWHGPIGGQLFAGVLFTVYYYAVMGLANRGSVR
ncbi:MAG TPA: cyanoexosortase C [Coleofasciculaceae cyanobacterium]